MRRLIIRPGGIGDCLLAFPAMEQLKAEYTEVWVPSAVVPLVHFADQVRSLASTGIDWTGIPGYQGPDFSDFDEIVSWYGTKRAEFREAVAGLPFRFLPALPEENSCVHAADFFLRQVSDRTDPAVPSVACPRHDDGYIAIQPFSGSAKKNWPLERYRELAARLTRPVRWCAAPHETLEGAVRFENLYELACWLAGASLYIGNDSGITHLAATVGTPIVALFGPTDPAIWGPRGTHVRVLRSSDHTMTGLSVDDVLAAVCD